MDGRLAAGHAWKVLDAVGCADAGGKDSAGRRHRQAIRHARESRRWRDGGKRGLAPGRTTCRASGRGAVRGGDKNILDDAFRRGRDIAILAQTFKMELDGRKQFVFSFFHGRAGCNTTGQVRDISGEIVSGFLDNNRIAHGFNLSVMPASECC